MTFHGASLLEIEIPPHLTSITYSCFSMCKFTSIVLPKAVALLDEWCFADCGSLAEVTIPDDSELQELRRLAFSGTILTSIRFTAKVRTLGELLF